jgi:hypothetical protein
MSYLGRVARRAAGVRAGAGLVPVGRSTSPLASFDQRLNLVPSLVTGRADRGDATASIDEAADAHDDPFAIAGLGQSRSGTEPSTGVLGPARAPAMRSGIEGPAFASPSPAVGSAALPGLVTAAGSLEDRPPEARRARTAAPEAPSALGGSAPTEAASRAEIVRAPAADLRLRGPAREIRAPLTDAAARGADAERDRASPAAGAAPLTPRAGGPVTAPASAAAAPTPPGRDPLTEALARLDRWLASEPRAERASRARTGAAESAIAGDGPSRADAPAGARSPAAARRQHGGRGGPSPLAAAPAPQAPILRIGRIEVQVVQPAPPPAVVSAPARRQAPSPRAPAGSGSWWGPPAHLMFGLRQR